MKSNILKNFGKKIKKFRKQKAWSQEVLANKCRLHRTYIGSIERGGRNISLINVEKIAKALGLSISELLR